MVEAGSNYRFVKSNHRQMRCGHQKEYLLRYPVKNIEHMYLYYMCNCVMNRSYSMAEISRGTRRTLSSHTPFSIIHSYCECSVSIKSSYWRMRRRIFNNFLNYLLKDSLPGTTDFNEWFARRSRGLQITVCCPFGFPICTDLARWPGHRNVN